MKLYRFTVGLDEKFYPFDNEKEAYEKRTTVDPSYNWLPVVIEEIKVDGFDIHVSPLTEPEEQKNKGGRPRKAAS